jgi:hypothetical protein
LKSKLYLKALLSAFQTLRELTKLTSLHKVSYKIVFEGALELQLYEDTNNQEETIKTES